MWHEYEFIANGDPSGWDCGAAGAMVVNLGSAREGMLKWEDNEAHYHWRIYEYQIPSKNEMRTYSGTVKFAASTYGTWFRKYSVGFKFTVLYNKANPTRHSQLNTFY